MKSSLILIGLGNEFLDFSPKAQATKAKTKQVGPHQKKRFCIAKEISNKMKRQHMDWKRIFVNHVLDKGLISKIYKELTQLNSKKTNNLIKNGHRN